MVNSQAGKSSLKFWGKRTLGRREEQVATNEIIKKSVIRYREEITEPCGRTQIHKKYVNLNLRANWEKT